MSEDVRRYQAFLEVLAKDPYDETTRRVFADWLEEKGLDDYAAEQRQWTRKGQEAIDRAKEEAFEEAVEKAVEEREANDYRCAC